ncbi:MAG: CBS domain-containing protein [Planctomycetota bacterium]
MGNSKKIKDLLKGKSSGSVWTIGHKSSVYDAIRRMSDLNVGALVVTHKGQILGIITERDYSRKVVLEGRSSVQTLVEEIMTHRVHYVEPDDSLEHAMAAMTLHRVRHLPVIEGGHLTGIVSIGDGVKDLISVRECVSDELMKYITGQTHLETQESISPGKTLQSQ